MPLEIGDWRRNGRLYSIGNIAATTAPHVNSTNFCRHGPDAAHQDGCGENRALRPDIGPNVTVAPNGASAIGSGSDAVLVAEDGPIVRRLADSN